MIKKIFITIVVLVMVMILFGCDNSPKEFTNKYELPDELSDCTIHQIYGTDTSARKLTVVRCPNSQTSTTKKESCGKNCTRSKTTVVIDGVEYEKKVKE